MISELLLSIQCSTMDGTFKSLTHISKFGTDAEFPIIQFCDVHTENSGDKRQGHEDDRHDSKQHDRPSLSNSLSALLDSLSRFESGFHHAHLLLFQAQ